ncbi:MAG: MjaI family restriction endonuclease [Rickettsiales bacterium]|jgi:hypothetical protein|nr:MjaI family restriction endonuclease [Rickettsiales bacterium]
MAKEWILNQAINRFQLNFKRNVGAVSEQIRNCQPKNLQEWESYYFKNVKTKEEIEELGRKLYVKISEVLQAEIEEITEYDCISYIKQLVVNRTYDGYDTEIKTIYGTLEKILNLKIEPAPDNWDRLYNVDFYIKINEKYIGIQIKPCSSKNRNIQLPEIFKERKLQLETHKKFEKNFGGKVFYVYSFKNKNGNKEIYNMEVIEEIKKEIKRLSCGIN